MALPARAPDVITRTAPPLSATSDQPLADVQRPPESASNDVADQRAGTPQEISGEELAAATIARKGAGPDADPKSDAAIPEPEAAPAAEAAGDVEAAPPKLEFDPIPENLPGYAVREITKHRKQAQAKADAAWNAARATVGDEAWTKALSVARDVQIDAARKEAKVAKDAEALVRRELDELRAKPAIEDKPAEDPRPTRDGFDDPDAYDDALTAWGKREGARETETAAAAARAETTRLAREKSDREATEARAAEVTKLNDNWNAKVTEAATRYDDFNDVITKAPEDGGPTISDAMVAGMMQVDNGPEVAYHLGLNVEESKRIAGLPNAARQLIEIGRLAERLANPPRRARPAPPIEPVDGDRAPAGENDNDLAAVAGRGSMDDYYAKRNPALQAGRRPFFPPGALH